VSLKILATLPGASALRDVTIRLGTISVSLIGLMTALIVFYLFVVTAWLVKDIMVRTLPARLHSDPGIIESVATLTRYSLLALGIIVSLGLLGLDFTSLAIIAGGLSVGIGIGLQDIVANFVSGLVLLFEQSLRPGDVIQLGDRISRVEKISLRATTVRTRTNVELTIPNTSFTTGEVKNLTKSEPRMKLIVPFGVSYSSDLEKVRQLAVDIALQHPFTMAYPPPTLIVRNLGDSSLDLDLSVSIDRPELSFSIRSDLYIAFRKAFSEHDIEIPFAQIDLNLREGWEKVASALHTNWPLGQADELPAIESKEEL
jgi:small-conductance mechanosensitive channel